LGLQDSAMHEVGPTVINWLIGNFKLFGVDIQNWMLAAAGGLLLYIVILMIARRWQRGVH
jgi:hypothetical protein